MKRRHLLLVALSLIITICMSFALVGCKKNKQPAPADPVALAVPTVTVDADGKAQWSAVEHASGYAYKVNDGEEKATNNTSVTLTDGQSIQVKAVGDGVNYKDSEWSQKKTYNKSAPGEPITLGVPSVEISASGLASWAAVTGASGYAYKLDDGAAIEVEADKTSVQLSAGQSISVQALGDGTAYKSGNWSTAKKYVAKLATPEVSISDEGQVSWGAVTGTNSYAYIINGGEQKVIVDATTLPDKLNDGDKIKVQAVGDNVSYSSSDWSEEKTYTAPVQQAQKLAAPVLSIDVTGKVTWAEVTGATGYSLEINGQGGGSTSGTEYDLLEGNSLRVKATSTDENYTDSDWSNSVTNMAVMSHADYLAANKNDIVKVSGVVTGITSDRVYFQDSDGGYLVYYGTNNIPEGVVVGKTIIVKGKLDVFYGLYQVIESSVAVGGDAAVTPIDVTAKFTAASAMTDDALVNMQSALVTIKGVTLKKGTDSNLYVVIGNNEAQLFVGSGKSHVLDADALAALTTEFEANLGKTADVKGYVSLFSSKFQLVPAQGCLVVDQASKTKLSAPVVTIDNATGKASWVAIPNASKYVYQIKEKDSEVWGSGVEVATSAALEVTLTDGQSIQVKAVGDDENYEDSAWSAAKTYNKPAGNPIPSMKAASISFATTAARVSQDANSQVWQSNDIKFTNLKGKSTTDIVDSSNPVKCYAHSTIKIEYSAITKLVFNCISNYVLALTTTTAYLVTTDGTVVTVEFFAPVNEFVVEDLANQARFSFIDVYVAKVAAPLAAPEVDIDDDGLATWDAVTGASGYEYVITHSDGTTATQTITDTQVQLADGDKIKVKSIGDGVDYASSDYCEELTYTMVEEQLATPAITINAEGEVRWDAIPHATKYEYQINSEEKVTINVTDPAKKVYTLPAPISDGDTITVQAFGTGRYTPSEVARRTWEAPKGPTVHENPTVEVARDGSVKISHADADQVEYTIANGEPATVALVEGSVTLDTKLTDEQTIKVVAKGNGSTYDDSAEVEVTYKAPKTLGTVNMDSVEFAIEGTNKGMVVVSWTAVDGASKYAYTIGEGTELFTSDNSATVTVALADEAVIKIRAVGDTNNAVAANGDYSDRHNDGVYGDNNTAQFIIETEKDYSVAEILALMNYYGVPDAATKTGTYPLSTEKFTVKGIVDSATYSAQYSNYTIYLKDNAEGEAQQKVQMFATIDSDLGNFADANALVGHKIAVNGTISVYIGSNNYISFRMTDCEVYEIDITDSERIELAKTTLASHINDISDKEDDAEKYGTYELPTDVDYGVTASEWTIVNESEVDGLIDNENGKPVLVVERAADDVEVKLTAKLTSGSVEVTLSEEEAIIITVRGTENVSVSWVEVKSADALKVGDVIVLTYINGTTAYAMAAQNGNFRNKVDLTNFKSASPDFGSFTKGVSDKNVVSILIESSGNTSFPFALKANDSGQYLTASGTSNNNLTQSASAEAGNCQWQLSNDLVFTANVSSGAKIIRYNSSSPRFTCYASGQQQVTIYKLASGDVLGSTGGGTTDPDPDPGPGTDPDSKVVIAITTADFSNTNSYNGSSSYTSSWTASFAGGSNWSFKSFNNNNKNSSWYCIKGGTSSVTTGEISVDIKNVITNITLTVSEINTSNITSVTLSVGGQQTDVTAKFTATGEISLDIPENLQGENKTYLLSFAFKSCSNGKAIAIKKLVYNGYAS